MKVMLELDETQAGVLNQALDMYSRMLMGQWRMLPNYFSFVSNIDFYDREIAIKYLLEARDLIYPELKNHDSWGIHNKNNPVDSKISYDIYQVIRNTIAWHNNPKGGMTVDFRRPCSTSGLELPQDYIKED